MPGIHWIADQVRNDKAAARNDKAAARNDKASVIPDSIRDPVPRQRGRAQARLRSAQHNNSLPWT
ncbi:MAG: hypothetical protein WCK94_08990 [Comamonadaceae bacterium]